MRARPGDWLVVNSARDAVHARYAEILSAADDGAPPYRVRWVDTDREGLLYPGPDATVLTAEAREHLDAERLARAGRVQAEIGTARQEATS